MDVVEPCLAVGFFDGCPQRTGAHRRATDAVDGHVGLVANAVHDKGVDGGSPADGLRTIAGAGGAAGDGGPGDHYDQDCHVQRRSDVSIHDQPLSAVWQATPGKAWWRMIRRAGAPRWCCPAGQ